MPKVMVVCSWTRQMGVCENDVLGLAKKKPMVAQQVLLATGKLWISRTLAMNGDDLNLGWILLSVVLNHTAILARHPHPHPYRGYLAQRRHQLHLRRLQLLQHLDPPALLLHSYKP
jgi:hypothetical protein